MTAMPVPSSADAPELDQTEVAGRLRLSVTRLSRILRQQADLGLTASQLTALATISREGPLTLGALAEVEHVSPPTITKIVEKLEALGVIERRIDDDDRRRILAATTQAGEDLLAEGRARKNAILITRMAQLDADQVARLAEALDALDALAGTERP